MTSCRDLVRALAEVGVGLCPTWCQFPTAKANGVLQPRIASVCTGAGAGSGSMALPQKVLQRVPGGFDAEQGQV